MLMSRMSFVVAVVLSITVPFMALAKEAVFEDCTIVKIDANQLTVSKGGNEHTAQVSSSVKVTIDNKEAKLSDLKTGQKVKLTVEKGDGKAEILRIDASK